ncbi:MAG: NAD(P)H-dependent oxidoreductase, partial [Spirochaetes bacterium]|nr:NAD(P)H-dependent oxidoreductase [Spirochaetota bacterium]
MKFVVLNGSPKGNEISTTMQYLYYMQKRVPGHEYEYFTIAKDIKKIENDKTELDKILKSIEKCDAVIWSMPVFLFLVPSQVKRFIEIIFERKKTKSFAGKYATVLFTSAMVFDHTAHNYIQAISEDFGMKFYRGYSVVMQDLQNKQCKESTKNFFLHFIAAIENKDPMPRRSHVISWKPAVYKRPVINRQKKIPGKKILLLTDHTPGTNLEQMVETYRESSKYEVEVLNVKDINIKGPCLDCLNCVFTGECVHKDGMKAYYDEKTVPADALIFAGTMVDRYLSSLWKKVFDRSFYNGHRPVWAWKEVALMISGPLRQEPNLLQIFEGLFSYTRMDIVGTVTDEDKDSKVTYGLIRQLAESVDRRLDMGPVFQQNFLSRGAHVILRDTIYSAAPILNADHKYFKKLG